MPIIEIKVTDETGKVLKEEEIKPAVKVEAKVSDDNIKDSEKGKPNRKASAKSKKS